MAKGSVVAIDIDVSRRLGDRVIAARFTAGPGLTALFGASGAGKTSILNMVAGLLRPDRATSAMLVRSCDSRCLA